PSLAVVSRPFSRGCRRPSSALIQGEAGGSPLNVDQAYHLLFRLTVTNRRSVEIEQTRCRRGAIFSKALASSNWVALNVTATACNAGCTHGWAQSGPHEGPR